MVVNLICEQKFKESDSELIRDSSLGEFEVLCYGD